MFICFLGIKFYNEVFVNQNMENISTVIHETYTFCKQTLRNR